MKTALLIIATLLWLVCSSGSLHAEPAPLTPPATVINDPHHHLSPADLQAMTEVINTLYLEGPEIIFSITALSPNSARVSIGMYYGPTKSHGMKFTLHRTPKGWAENRQDKSKENATVLWKQ